MKPWYGSLIIICCATACSAAGSNPFAFSPFSAHVKPATSNYKSIYSFRSHADDGGYPLAPLIDVNGTLYGTTEDGGKYNDGTVFSITTNGKEKVLHSFSNAASDGYYPVAGLLEVNGTLYGTTMNGGAYKDSYGGGTVYRVTTSGKEKVLHSFGGPSDGCQPTGSLIDVNGRLYGTTVCNDINGGAGTVFSITTSGKEKVVYAFGPPTPYDGDGPKAALVDLGGVFYGTTVAGGTHTMSSSGGTVFSLKIATLKEMVLVDFGGSNGVSPQCTLLDVKGLLYGTTPLGGKDWGSNNSGAGTVFTVTTKGKQKVLYNFSETGGDGQQPFASLIDVNGILYGTTEYGGSNAVGTIYSITTKGKETPLYSFQNNGTDGYGPAASLLDVSGTLYGTTVSGGVHGAGTVFKYTL
jgi:uncharacterized repeat protein (TIGR03803 family)